MIIGNTFVVGSFIEILREITSSEHLVVAFCNVVRSVLLVSDVAVGVHHVGLSLGFDWVRSILVCAFVVSEASSESSS